MNPTTELDKYQYITQTPTWWVRVVFLVGLAAWALVVWAYTGAVMHDQFFRWVMGPILFLFTLYHISHYGVSLFYKQMDLKKHLRFRDHFWATNSEPSVDIFLPICGEDISIIENTWKHVAQIEYKNMRVHVLDDSKTELQEHLVLARKYGFNYLSRPNKGEMKKAGNLKYGYERTKGEFALILDSDFAPHKDILKEVIPYMATDESIGIIQTPQYFYPPSRASEVHKRSPLEYGAAYAQEEFYRIGQVARSRFGATLCCGTSAFYRRAAWNSIGGPLQVDKSEDSRTGFAMLSKGWKIEFLPILLTMGVCPDNTFAYFHQQHRWASGRTELTLSKEFWTAPVTFTQRMIYLSGFLFYLLHPLAILMSFHLFYTLFFYNEYIALSNLIPFLPWLLFTFLLMPLFHIMPWRPGSIHAGMAQLYAHSHAVITALMGKSVAWIATNGKHTSLSPSFVQTRFVLTLILLFQIGLIALAIFTGYFHVTEYNYYSVQFWIVFNALITAFLWAHFIRDSYLMGKSRA